MSSGQDDDTRTCISSFSTLVAAEVVFILVLIYISCGVCKKRKVSNSSQLIWYQSYRRKKDEKILRMKMLKEQTSSTSISSNKLSAHLPTCPLALTTMPPACQIAVDFDSIEPFDERSNQDAYNPPHLPVGRNGHTTGYYHQQPTYENVTQVKQHYHYSIQSPV